MKAPVLVLGFVPSILVAHGPLWAHPKVEEFVAKDEVRARLDYWRKAREAYDAIWAGQEQRLAVGVQ